MIQSIRHKGLKKFYETNSTVGIRQDQAAKLRRILTFLNRAKNPEDMNLPGYTFHPLTGDLKGCYSLKMNKNWRLIFRFDEDGPYDVDLVDYH